MDSQIPFFCGDSEVCRTIGSRDALEQAKNNIVKNFVMVGILEDLDMTHAVMECLMPHLFKGLVKEHSKQNLHIHGKHKDKSSLRYIRQISLN